MRVFDRSFRVFAVLAVVSGAACYLVLGRDAFLATFADDVGILVLIVPKLGAALLVGGFIQVLLPRDRVARWLGDQAGAKAVAIAAAAGMVTPGGPMTSFPLVSALHEAGSGRTALVAYLTSWSTLGLQRIVSWELPLMGIEFAAVRFAASLPLPFIAGLMSRLLPVAADAAASQDD